MATVPPMSMLSRTRSGRVPSGKSKPDAVSMSATAAVSAHVGHAGHVGRGAHPTAAATHPTGTGVAPSPIAPPASSVSVFLTNLRLLDLDQRPDWPHISDHTFARDAAQGQKRRIHSVEWALYHLVCLWDPEEAKTVQSVTLRAGLLRALEQAKRSGALGRDAVLRKTMLDECRGERFEEILAAFSSAVLKKALVDEARRGLSIYDRAAVARHLALENRGYAADRTQLNALILAHRVSLDRLLRDKAAARARYQDFAELLALKERSIARQRELAKVLAAEADNADDVDEVEGTSSSVSDDVKLHLQRLVRNNWAGSDQWMQTLLYGDDAARGDRLLSTPPDRVWRRVRAGRLGELEGKAADSGGGGGRLLEQLDKRVAVQKDRLRRWDEYSKHILRTPTTARADAQGHGDARAGKPKTGIDLGFTAHVRLYPVLSPPRKGSAMPHNDDYVGLLRDFEAELAASDKPPSVQESLTALLGSRRAGGNSRNASRAHGRYESAVAKADVNNAHDTDAADVADDAHEAQSDISDMDEHPSVQQAQAALSAPASEDSQSPTRRRVLLTKPSMTFSIKSYHSDDDAEPPDFAPPAKIPQLPRAAMIQVDQPLPQAVRKLSGQMGGGGLTRRQRQRPWEREQSPPIRRPRAARPAPPQTPDPQRAPVVERTPSPDLSPPPPSPPLDDEGDGPLELVSTPQHSIVLQRPASEDRVATATSNTSPSQELADQILASMNNASPSPVKRPRHTLSLAERTRMSMARASRRSARPLSGYDDDSDGDDNSDRDAYALGGGYDHLGHDDDVHDHGPVAAGGRSMQSDGDCCDGSDSNGSGNGKGNDDYEDLVARTRRSMAGYEASRQKAQIERRRSQRQQHAGRSSLLGVGPAAAAASTAMSRREAGGYGFSPLAEADYDGNGDEDASMLAEELMAGGQDDAEAIFRSRPKIKMSPIPSPTRELEYEY